MATPAKSARGACLGALALLAAACGEARSPAPTATAGCADCHGLPPATNLHAVHVAADSGAGGGIPHPAIACVNCHLNVTSVNQPDHIYRADGSLVPGLAEVRFDDPAALAAITQPGAARAGPPGFDAGTLTCSNVYCHGAAMKGPTSGLVLSPAWNAPHGTVGCGNCHGIPPADHAVGLTQLDCVKCHAGAIDAQGNLNPATHVDGKVQLSAQ
jgi:predicted CxxxxCH...CXXCH cytochrome family protein